MNVRATTIKLTEKNTANLHDLGLGNGFLDRILKAQQKQTKKTQIN